MSRSSFRLHLLVPACAALGLAIAVAGCPSEHETHTTTDTKTASPHGHEGQDHGGHGHAATETKATAAPHEHAAGEEHSARPGTPAKDIVCGMAIAADAPITAAHGDITYRFCSEQCRSRFAADPAAALTATCRCSEAMENCDCGHCGGQPWYCPCGME